MRTAAGMPVSASGSYGNRSRSSCAHISLSGSTCATSIVGDVRLLVGEHRELAPVAEAGHGGLRDPAHDVGDLERSGEHRVGALEELGSFARRALELEERDRVRSRGRSGRRPAAAARCRRRRSGAVRRLPTSSTPSSVSACSGTPAALRTLVAEHLADRRRSARGRRARRLRRARRPVRRSRGRRARADGVDSGSNAVPPHSTSSRPDSSSSSTRTVSHSRSAGDAPGDLGEQLVDRQPREREVADLLQPGEAGGERLLGLERLRAAQRLRAQVRRRSRGTAARSRETRGARRR